MLKKLPVDAFAETIAEQNREEEALQDRLWVESGCNPGLFALKLHLVKAQELFDRLSDGDKLVSGLDQDIKGTEYAIEFYGNPVNFVDERLYHPTAHSLPVYSVTDPV